MSKKAGFAWLFLRLDFPPTQATIAAPGTIACHIGLTRLYAALHHSFSPNLRRHRMTSFRNIFAPRMFWLCILLILSVLGPAYAEEEYLSLIHI
jgi:hypothetical protein